MRTADTEPMQDRLHESSPLCSKGKDRLPRSDCSRSSSLKRQRPKKVKQNLTAEPAVPSHLLQSSKNIWDVSVLYTHSRGESTEPGPPLHTQGTLADHPGVSKQEGLGQAAFTDSRANTRTQTIFRKHTRSSTSLSLLGPEIISQAPTLCQAPCQGLGIKQLTREQRSCLKPRVERQTARASGSGSGGAGQVLFSLGVVRVGLQVGGPRSKDRKEVRG